MSAADGDEVACPCGQVFDVPRSLRGGIANCPQCRQAVKIGGGHDPLFYALVGAGVLAVLIATAIAGWAGGFTAAAITFVVGAGILGLMAVLS